MNKKLLFSYVLLLFFVSYAWAEINVDETAKILGAYLNFTKVSVPKEDQLKELKGIERNLDQELNTDPNNPRLWWLTGLNAWSFVHVLQEPLTDKEKELKKYYQFELTNEAFKKALDLDRGNEPHLTLDMLYSLYKFGFLDVHVEAGRRIIEEDPNLEPRSEL